LADKDIDSDDWRENPFRTAREFRHLKDSGEFDPGLWARIVARFGSGDSMAEEERDALKPFLEFIEEGDYYSASVISSAVLDESPAKVDNAVETVLNNLLKNNAEIDSREINEAFSLLDSFKQGPEITEDNMGTTYSYSNGERVIDNLATSIWQGLDGSAQAFFEMYLEEQSDAVILDEDGEKKEISYAETALEYYEQVLEEDPYMGESIAERFDLPEEKVRRAKELQHLEELIDSLAEGAVSELTDNDLDLIEEENVDLDPFDDGNRFNTDIGNFLTDKHLWRRNPEEAQYAGDEEITERIRLSREGRRSAKPSEEETRIIFNDLMRSNDFYAASMYAETADIDPEKQVENTALSLIEVGEKKKAFAALDAFNYEKTTDELLEENYTDFYLVKPGPSRLIDKLATDIWMDLEGASRAFFQMYINNIEDKKIGTSQDTVAKVYHPLSQKPRGEDAYLEDVFNTYESTINESEEKADEILDRFNADLPSY